MPFADDQAAITGDVPFVLHFLVAQIVQAQPPSEWRNGRSAGFSLFVERRGAPDAIDGVLAQPEIFG